MEQLAFKLAEDPKPRKARSAVSRCAICGLNIWRSPMPGFPKMGLYFASGKKRAHIGCVIGVLMEVRDAGSR